jgi:hypothetical protein
MKMKSLLPVLAMLNLAVGAIITTVSPAKESNGSPQGQQPSNAQLRTFSGTVWQNGGRFVLRDESHKIWYQLDNQRWAAGFEGKEVRITGTLDPSNNAIHVQYIEEDPVRSK